MATTRAGGAAPTAPEAHPRLVVGAGVGAHRGGVSHEPVDRMATRLFEQLGVFVDFAADDRAQPGHDVAAEPAAAHDNPKALTFNLGHPVTADIFRRNYEHCPLRLRQLFGA